jgi:hypothetical protein
MDHVKKLVFDGILASRDLEDLSKSLPTHGQPLIARTSFTESTDPSWYPVSLVAAASRMADVYYRLYLFENQARRLIESVLEESKGPNWWETCVDKQVRDKASFIRKEEAEAKFHHPRGDKLIDYVSMPDLGKIIEQNWGDFEDILFRKEWALGKFEELRLTRNAMAHMSDVSPDDLVRLDVILKDWNQQVA